MGDEGDNVSPETGYSFKGSPVLGVLSDISGVLSESSAGGDGVAITGSVDAIKKLRKVSLFNRNLCNSTISISHS